MTNFLIQHPVEGWIALVYGDGKVTGIDVGNPEPWIERFGWPLPAPASIWDDFANKGK